MTKQIKDKLIYKNEIFLIDKFLLNNKFDFGDNRNSFSACWRGYVGTFEIIENKICLKEIQFVNNDDNLRKVELIKDLVSENNFLFWLNELIWIENNDLIIVFEIKDGIIITNLELNFDEFEKFKEKQFNKYFLSKEYQTEKQNFIENSLSKINSEEKKEKWLNTIFNEELYNNKLKNNILHNINKIF